MTDRGRLSFHLRTTQGNYEKRNVNEKDTDDEIDIFECLTRGLDVEEVGDRDEGKVGARPDDVSLPCNSVDSHWGNHDNQECEEPVCCLLGCNVSTCLSQQIWRSVQLKELQPWRGSGEAQSRRGTARE